MEEGIVTFIISMLGCNGPEEITEPELFPNGCISVVTNAGSITVMMAMWNCMKSTV